MKRHVTRHGRILGGYVPVPLVEGIKQWVSQHPERDISTFIREAAREKLNRSGIAVPEEVANLAGIRVLRGIHARRLNEHGSNAIPVRERGGGQ